jgi:hypothetical protein
MKRSVGLPPAVAYTPPSIRWWSPHLATLLHLMAYVVLGILVPQPLLPVAYTWRFFKSLLIIDGAGAIGADASTLQTHDAAASMVPHWATAAGALLVLDAVACVTHWLGHRGRWTVSPAGAVRAQSSQGIGDDHHATGDPALENAARKHKLIPSPANSTPPPSRAVADTSSSGTSGAWWWSLDAWQRYWTHAHGGHHVHDHPPAAFLRTGYVAAEIDNTRFYLPSLAVAPALALLGASWTGLATTATAGYLAFQWAGLVALCSGLLKLADIVHVEFHKAGSWMEASVPGFIQLRAIHFWHHVGRANFGIGSFWVDFLALGLRTDRGHPRTLSQLL